MKVLPAAIFLLGNVPLRLSVGTAGGATHPGTGLAGAVRAEVGWAPAWAIGADLLLLFRAKLAPTNPPIMTTMTTTMPRTCLFRLESISRCARADWRLLLRRFSLARSRAWGDTRALLQALDENAGFGRIRGPRQSRRATGGSTVAGSRVVTVRLTSVLTIGFPAVVAGTNCYVLAPGAGEECLIVDPGVGVTGQLADLLREHHLRPAAVLLTHGHFDHVYSVTPVCSSAGVTAYIHGADRYRLKDPLSAGRTRADRHVRTAVWPEGGLAGTHRRDRAGPRPKADDRRPRPARTARARPYPRFCDVRSAGGARRTGRRRRRRVDRAVRRCSVRGLHRSH